MAGVSATAVSWSQSERLPKLVREPLYQFYRILAERKVLKGYKTTLPLLDKNIAELQAGMQTPECKRHRFPQFFNNMLFFHIAIKDILLTHKELLLAKDLDVLPGFQSNP